MDELTDKQLNGFRQSLMKIREELLVLLDISAEAGEAVVLDQTKVGRLSRMDALQQQQMSNACRAGYKKRLIEVQHALSILEQGVGGSSSCDSGLCEYGWCEQCGELINIHRLEVKPESRFCVGC
jgi:RNA polymerase-binding transcription factor